jgi:hypothetical protein
LNEELSEEEKRDLEKSMEDMKLGRFKKFTDVLKALKWLKGNE